MQIIRQKNFSLTDGADINKEKQLNWVRRCALSLEDIAKKDPKTILDPNTLFLAPAVTEKGPAIIISENIVGDSGSSVISMNPSEAFTIAMGVITIMVGYGANTLEEISKSMKDAVDSGVALRKMLDEKKKSE